VVFFIRFLPATLEVYDGIGELWGVCVDSGEGGGVFFVLRVTWLAGNKCSFDQLHFLA
jgi:hypothetical protein